MPNRLCPRYPCPNERKDCEYTLSKLLIVCKAFLIQQTKSDKLTKKNLQKTSFKS
ncbi:hypothetical protein Mapa_017175 [Marchantia paleacea]|nr:hypothetical protein Mapa_017175 [Marchantia paleacea]